MSAPSWLEDYLVFSQGNWSQSAYRRKLQQNACELLRDPAVKKTKVDSRVRYLLTRGLSLDDIEHLFEACCSATDLEIFLVGYDRHVESDTEEVKEEKRKAKAPPPPPPLWRSGTTVYACPDPEDGRYYPVPLVTVKDDTGAEHFEVTFMAADGTYERPRHVVSGLKGCVADVLPVVEVLTRGMEVIAAVPEQYRGHYEEHLVLAVHGDTVDLEHIKTSRVVRDVPLCDIRTLEHPAVLKKRLEDRLSSEATSSLMRDRVMSNPVFPVVGARARSAGIAELTQSATPIKGAKGAASSTQRTAVAEKATLQERREMANTIRSYQRYGGLDGETSPQGIRTYAQFLERYGEGTATPRQMPLFWESQRTLSSVAFGFDLSVVSHHERYRPLLRYNPILEAASQCIEMDTMFVDADFPPTMMSLYGDSVSSESRGKIQWRRASEVVHCPYLQSAGSKPYDLLGGVFSPAWLAPIIYRLQSLPEFEDTFSPTDDGWLYGAYVVRLYLDATWYFVVVDDFLPYDTVAKQFVTLSLRHSTEIYPMILEKALAKMHGSYAALARNPKPGLSARSAWDDLTSGHADKIVLRILSKKTDLAANLHEVKRDDNARCCVVPRIVSKCTTPQASMLNSMGFSLGDYCLLNCTVTNARGDVFFHVSNPWGRLPPCPEAFQQSLLRTVSADWIEHLNSNIPEGTTPGVWLSFALLTELFDAVFLLWNESNAQKGVVEGTFLDHRGSSIFDLSCEFTANPQIYLNLPQQCNVTVEFRLMRQNPPTPSRNATRMHMHILPANGFEENLEEGIRPDDAMSSNLIDLIDDADAQEYPVVTYTASMAPGGYVIVPDLGRPDSDERFCIRVFADFGFSMRLLQ